MQEDSFSRKVLSKREKREQDLREFQRQTEEADEEIKQWSRRRHMLPESEDRIQKRKNNDEKTNKMDQQHVAQFNEESISQKLQNIRSLLGIQGSNDETKETGNMKDQPQYSMNLLNTFGKDAQEYHQGGQHQMEELEMKGEDQLDSTLGEFKIDTRRFLDEYIDNCEEILDVSNSNQKQFEEEQQKPRDLNTFESRSNYIKTDQVSNNRGHENMVSHSSQSSIINNFNYSSYPRSTYQTQFSQLDHLSSPNMVMSNKNQGQFNGMNYNSSSKTDLMKQGMMNPAANKDTYPTQVQEDNLNYMNSIQTREKSIDKCTSSDNMKVYQEKVNIPTQINQSRDVQQKELNASYLQRKNSSQPQNNSSQRDSFYFGLQNYNEERQETDNSKQNMKSLRSLSQHHNKQDKSDAAEMNRDQTLNDITWNNYTNNSFKKMDEQKKEEWKFEAQKNNQRQAKELSPFKLKDSSPFKTASPDKSTLSNIALDKNNYSLLNQSQTRIFELSEQHVPQEQQSVDFAQKYIQNSNFVTNIPDKDDGDNQMLFYHTENDFQLNESSIPNQIQDKQRIVLDNGKFQKDSKISQLNNQDTQMNSSSNYNQVEGRKEKERQLSIKEGQHRLLEDRDSKVSSKQSNLKMNNGLINNECTLSLNEQNSNGYQKIASTLNDSNRQGYGSVQNDWSGGCVSNSLQEGNLKRRLELAIEESNLNWKDQVEELEQRVKEQEQEIAIRINQERATRQQLSQQLNEGFLREEQLRTQLDFQKKEIDSMRLNRDFLQGSSHQELKTKLIEMETDLYITRGQCQTLAFEKSLVEQQIEQMQHEHRLAIKNVEVELEQEHAQELKTLNHTIKSLRSFNFQIINEIGVKPKLKTKEKVDKTNVKVMKGGETQKPKKRILTKQSIEQGLSDKKKENSSCDCEKLRSQLCELKEEIDVLRDGEFKASEEKRWAEARLRKQSFLECRVERIVQERRELHMQDQMLYWKKTCGQILAGVLRECHDVKRENTKLKNELVSTNQKFLVQQQHSIQAQLQEEFQTLQQSHQTIKELQSKYNTAQTRLAEARTKIKSDQNILTPSSNKNTRSHTDQSIASSKYQFTKPSK